MNIINNYFLFSLLLRGNRFLLYYRVVSVFQYQRNQLPAAYFSAQTTSCRNFPFVMLDLLRCTSKLSSQSCRYHVFLGTADQGAVPTSNFRTLWSGKLMLIKFIDCIFCDPVWQNYTHISFVAVFFHTKQ